MPTQMTAQEAFILAMKGRDGVIHHSDYSLAQTVSFDLGKFIDERTTVEWRRTYLKGLVEVTIHAPWASEVYNYAWQELKRALEEISEEPSADSLWVALRDNGITVR